MPIYLHMLYEVLGKSNRSVGKCSYSACCYRVSINNKEYGCLHSRILRIRPSRVKNMPVVVDLKSPNCSGFFCIEMQYIKCNVQLYMRNQEHLYVHMHMYGMHFLKPHILCFEKYALILCMYSKRECQL